MNETVRTLELEPLAEKPKRAPRPSNGPHPVYTFAPKDFERLRRLNCTQTEAAATLDCSHRTFARFLKKREFREAWERGLEKAKVSVRRNQFRLMEGNGMPAVRMVEFMSDILLGERPGVNINVDGTMKIEIVIDSVDAKC